MMKHAAAFASWTHNEKRRMCIEYRFWFYVLVLQGLTSRLGLWDHHSGGLWKFRPTEVLYALTEHSTRAPIISPSSKGYPPQPGSNSCLSCQKLSTMTTEPLRWLLVYRFKNFSIMHLCGWQQNVTCFHKFRCNEMNESLTKGQLSKWSNLKYSMCILRPCYVCCLPLVLVFCALWILFAAFIENKNLPSSRLESESGDKWLLWLPIKCSLFTGRD